MRDDWDLQPLIRKQRLKDLAEKSKYPIVRKTANWLRNLEAVKIMGGYAPEVR